MLIEYNAPDSTNILCTTDILLLFLCSAYVASWVFKYHKRMTMRPVLDQIVNYLSNI